MTAHVIVTLNVTNPETLAEYRSKAGDAVTRHKGTPLQASTDTLVLEGDRTKPDAAVVLAFPDRDHAQNWINDPELADIHALRRAGSDSWIVLL